MSECKNNNCKLQKKAFCCNCENNNNEYYIIYYKEYRKSLWAAEKKYINCLVGFSVLTLLLLVMIGFLSLK
jgi:hypothetical protein